MVSPKADNVEGLRRKDTWYRIEGAIEFEFSLVEVQLFFTTWELLGGRDSDLGL